MHQTVYKPYLGSSGEGWTVSVKHDVAFSGVASAATGGFSADVEGLAVKVVGVAVPCGIVGTANSSNSNL